MSAPLWPVRVASALVVFALLVELVTLFWSHPLSFIAFAVVGGAALGGGVVLYLWWLLFGRPVATPGPAPAKEP
jgi:hypothetical protein